MRLAALFVVTAISMAPTACREPVAPMIMACDDDYHPAMCVDGDEVCETDDRGCRVCSCDDGGGGELD